VTPGSASRLLKPLLTSTDDSVLGMLPDLRAALSGQGAALLPHGPALRSWPAGTDRTRQTGLPALSPTSLPMADDDPHDPTAVAIATSGSTGPAKTVLLPASALLASASATHDRLGGAGHWLLALPVEHVAGLQVLVRSLIAGTRPTVLDLTGGFTAGGFAAAAAGMRPGRRYTSLVPTQVVRLLDAPGTAARDALRSFDAVLIGGAATAPSLLERAAAAGVRLVTTYGMSETGGGCVYDGVPLDGVRVELDEDGGRILLGGAVLARGYLGDPAATAQAFPTDRGARWFRTDDAGAFDRAGPDRTVLSVLGRLDSMIISGGLNIPPGPVEAALTRLPGVAQAVVVGLPDRQWGERVAAALVLAPGAAPPALAAARALVADEVAPESAPRQLTVLDALPLRGPGKPDRAAITRMLTEIHPLEGL
jgi:O-succinylbenzoic acid--CoA ligase